MKGRRMRQEEIWEMFRGLVGVYVVTQRIDSKFSFSGKFLAFQTTRTRLLVQEYEQFLL
jgi:hypothetical protein